MEAATEMLWKKRYPYKQLFWNLPGEFFSQNPWKILVFNKKSLFLVKLNNHVPGSFDLRKKQVKNAIFGISLLGKNLKGMQLKVTDCQCSVLLKMNFFIGIFQEFWLQISEQLFSRIPFKWLPLQRHIQDLVKHLRCSFFVNVINGLKLLTVFTKKLHLRCFTRFCVCLCNEVTSFIYHTYKFKVYCSSFWRHYNVFDIVLQIQQCFAANTKTIIYIT